jgi:phage baseplate assembly protein W
MPFLKDVNFYTPKSKPEVSDGEVARQEIALLLNTVPKEKPFDSNYGVDLESYLFDLITTANANNLYFEISDKVKTYVKTVNLDVTRSSVRVNSSQDGYDINLIFKLKNAPDDGSSYKVTKNINRGNTNV